MRGQAEFGLVIFGVIAIIAAIALVLLFTKASEAEPNSFLEENEFEMIYFNSETGEENGLQASNLGEKRS